MPISRSRPRGARLPAAPARSPLLRPLILIVVLAALAVTVICLPASLVNRFLPPSIGAEDFSGNLWHGSAGRITLNGREAGAVEWRLHPAALLLLTVSADLHWVNVGFVADATADVDRHGMIAHDLRGGGPLEDLSSVGITSGWRGTTQFKLDQVKAAFAADGSGAGGPMNLLSANGEINVADLGSPRIANGADLGGYVLHITDQAITPDADTTAELADTGGPLELKASIHLSMKQHTGTLSGLVKARADAPPALRNQLDSLAQLHAPDASGRIPIEFEFTL
jgi:hypothetical protein